MNYRLSTAVTNGFEDEQDELAAMRDYIQTMMRKSGPLDFVDSILILANICEERALIYSRHRNLARWYTRTAVLMRGALEILSHDKTDFLPQAKLENPVLYFPDVEHAH